MITKIQRIGLICCVFCTQILVSCTVLVSKKRLLGVDYFSYDPSTRRYITFKEARERWWGGGPYCVEPSPEMSVNEVIEYNHYYIIRAQPYMNRHTQCLIFSIRDDELLKENMDNIVATEYPYLITSNLVPVYKEDSDIMMERICKIGRTTKEKEEIKRAFLKDNYYEEYGVLDAQFSQGNLFTISDLNGIHRLSPEDKLVNYPERFYIELVTSKKHKREYHVYFRKY
ncbi:MAG: hypothetical protein K6E44_01970 [Bacteroidales bacterium]|nr:hypothetical protein [Bacteroidales bacterium]